MSGFIVVEPQGIATDRDLRRWVAVCERFVTSLPPKRLAPAKRGAAPPPAPRRRLRARPRPT